MFSEWKVSKKGWQNEVRKDPKELKKRILSKTWKMLFRYSKSCFSHVRQGQEIIFRVYLMVARSEPHTDRHQSKHKDRSSLFFGILKQGQGADALNDPSIAGELLEALLATCIIPRRGGGGVGPHGEGRHRFFLRAPGGGQQDGGMAPGGRRIACEHCCQD